MRILQFGKHYRPDTGGIETVMYELTTQLNARGLPCDVLCASTSPRTTVAVQDGYQVVRVGSLGKLFSTAMCPMLIWWLFKLRRRYDIIHAHMPDPLALIALFLVRPRAKLVLHWHADIDYERFRAVGALYRPLDRWLARACDHVIGATRAHIECSSNRLLFAGKSSVIPYFLSASPAGAKPAKIEDERITGKFVVFSMGRLIYYKGFEYLVDAAQHLPDDCVVLIGGSGPLGAALQERIRALDLERKVLLLGRVPDEQLEAYYERCQVFCLPSTHRGEMFGMVQIEAMRAGRPVVSTRIPNSGVAEVNLDGVTGFVVPPRDGPALAARILELKSDKVLYDRMAGSGAQRAREVYDADVVMPNLMRLYQSLLRPAV